MNPVVHFEMPASNKKRMMKFYENVFGWKTQALGKEMDDYLLVTTTPVDKNGMPKGAGAINGGFYQKNKQYKEPSVVISVDNLEESMKKIKRGKGKILGKLTKIPGVGLFVSFRDTEGNRVGMLQPS